MMNIYLQINYFLYISVVLKKPQKTLEIARNVNYF